MIPLITSGATWGRSPGARSSDFRRRCILKPRTWESGRLAGLFGDRTGWKPGLRTLMGPLPVRRWVRLFFNGTCANGGLGLLPFAPGGFPGSVTYACGRAGSVFALIARLQKFPTMSADSIDLTVVI
jgi:hypothetical protein